MKKKKKKIKKKSKKRSSFKTKLKVKKRRKKLRKKRVKYKKIIKRKHRKKTKKTVKKSSKETFRKIIRLADKLKPRFKINLNPDKIIQSFFQKISDKIDAFKQVIEEEREKKRADKLKEMRREKEESIKKAKLIQEEEIREKQKEIRNELKLSRERKMDLKKFIKIEQAKVRKEQAERQRKFYEKIKLEKKIEQFRKREAIEIKNLEKYVLNQEREDYAEVQERIERIRQKYQSIRDQKIRERIEQLGIEVTDSDSRIELLEKERQFNLAREKIENTLESFYRSMASCVFQLNKRWLPKKMSLLRVIDKRYETSEIFIKLDEETDENWVILVYLKNNDPNSNIIVEDKTNPEKNISLELHSNEIFKFSDTLVDSLTSMIDREFKKKIN